MEENCDGCAFIGPCGLDLEMALYVIVGELLWLDPNRIHIYTPHLESGIV